ncbi:MAG: hypothetical protein Q9160_004389 [Pyrenula sp. 1 TL-2023]
MRYLQVSLLVKAALWPSAWAEAGEQKVIKNKSNFKLDDAFDEKVNEILEHYHVPGLALTVIDNERTFAKGYGYRTLPSTAMTPETLFFTGSTGKAFTAGAASKLVDNPKYPEIQWNTHLADVMREDFVLQDPYYTNHVTFEDALSHRTGLPRHDFIWVGIEGLKVKDVVRKLRYLPLTAELRTTYQYCNLMFATVGHAIETVTGIWLGDFLRTQIWEPLQMNSTYFSLSDALSESAPPLATGYEWSNASQSTFDVEWPYMDAMSGAGGVISNVLDYSRWIRSLFNRSGPFTDASYTKFITAHSIPDPVFYKHDLPWNISFSTSGALYGLGWDIRIHKDEVLISHQGGIMGFGTTVMYLPGRKWGFVAMGNVMGEGNFAGTRIGTDLLDEFLDTPSSERVNWDLMDSIRDGQLLEARNQSCWSPFPSLPDPPLLPALDVVSYTGTFEHPAYPELTLSLCNLDVTMPICPERTKSATPRICGTFPGIKRLELKMELSHASGESWLAEVQVGHQDKLNQIAPVTFEISPNGSVDRIGIGLEPSMGPDGRIWFDKRAN